MARERCGRTGPASVGCDHALRAQVRSFGARFLRGFVAFRALGCALCDWVSLCVSSGVAHTVSEVSRVLLRLVYLWQHVLSWGAGVPRAQGLTPYALTSCSTPLSAFFRV